MIINREEILLNDTWIPIYISLKHKLVSDYRSVDFRLDLKEVIQPEQENVLLVCDGLDEYSDPEGIESLKEKLLNIKSEITSIAKLKIIFTTRPEAGFPEELGIKKYVRLLSFSPGPSNRFF